MKIFLLTFSVAVSTIFSCTAAFAKGKRPIALVYSGPGACSIEDGDCVSAAAEVAKRAGLNVKYVEPGYFKPSDFDRAVVWIQPGGDAIETAIQTSAQEKNMIKNFLRRGGAYLGFCAGAFFADTWVDNDNTVPGLAILPGVSFDLTQDEKPMMVYVLWEGLLRSLYFQAGPYFQIHDEQSRVVANYLDDKPAVVYTQYGLGRVALSGPHPEAPQSWIQDDALDDSDGPDHDLSDQMLSWLLNAPTK